MKMMLAMISVLVFMAAGCSPSATSTSPAQAAAETNAPAIPILPPAPAPVPPPALPPVPPPVPAQTSAPAPRSAAGQVIDAMTGKTMVDVSLRTRAKIKKINADRQEQFDQVQNAE